MFPAVTFGDSSRITHPPTHVVPQGGSDFYGYFYQVTITGTNTTTNNNDGTATVACSGGGATNNLLLEDSSAILLEDGTHLVLQ